MITYSDRLIKINSISDLDHELCAAKRYMQTLKTKVLKAKSLAEKLVLHDDLKTATATLRKLRQNYFLISDSISDPMTSCQQVGV